VLFDEPTVALRGPWGGGDLIKVGPSAEDLADGLYEYHLDFPGNALEPGCDYEQWARRLTKGKEPTVYAHVATDPAHPGKLALQYWIFYAYNDWNNLHEGDWEMVQLVFDADDARAALATKPTEIGYSQHEGAERAGWDSEKLEREDDTHPVVHPAAGSHANFFDEGLHLGSSAEQGVGCDDTTGPTYDLRPVVLTIPNDPAEARARYPWIDFQGRWGELQRAFFNGPTGPNLKTQWTEPITWSEDWRDRSYAVPAGGALGTGATDFFCGCGRGRLQGGAAAGERAAAGLHRARPPGRAAPVPDLARDLEPDGAAPARTPPRLGPDPVRVGAHVRPSHPAVRRHRARAAADLRRRHPAAVGGRPRREHPRRPNHGQTGGLFVLVRGRDRLDADPPRPRPRDGGDHPCARRDRRGGRRSGSSTPTGSRSTASARCSAPSRSPSSSSRCWRRRSSCCRSRSGSPSAGRCSSPWSSWRTDARSRRSGAAPSSCGRSGSRSGP
jgi:hypothetical protein